MTALALKDVCRLLKVQPYRVQHAYSIGAVEEPRLRISGRRVFEPIDIKRLAKHFGVTLKTDRAEQAVAADAE